MRQRSHAILVSFPLPVLAGMIPNLQNRAFYKILGPFIDPVTKDKIRFTRQASEARDFVDPEQLEKECFGGDLDFEYASLSLLLYPIYD